MRNWRAPPETHAPARGNPPRVLGARRIDIRARERCRATAPRDDLPPLARHLQTLWRQLACAQSDAQRQSIGSFSINIRNGLWADFATNDAGRDVISLHAYLHRMTQIEAARDLAKQLGVTE